MRSALRTLGLGLLALTATACEDGINFCTDRNDAGECPEIPDFRFDASIDATTPPPDAAADARADATTSDATITMDATTDAGTDAATPTSYNVEEFCAAQYAVAIAWRDKFEQCCGSASTAAAERSLFLFNALLYDDGSEKPQAESVGACVEAFNATVGANLTFGGTAAVGCASRFAAQFEGPPAACPAVGFKIEELEAMIGHRAQATAQLPECRAAFVGNVPLNGACTSSYQCASGNRCLGSDGSRTCRPPLTTGNGCTSTFECADGLICQGSGSPGRSCQPANVPVSPTSKCSLSSECESGYLCDSTCVLPAPVAICAQ